MKKQIVLSVILIFVLFSCNKEEQIIDDPMPICDYEEFASVLKNDLSQIGMYVRDAESDFTNQKVVLKSAESYYCNSSEDFMRFSLSFNENLNKGYDRSDLSDFEMAVVQDVEDAIASSMQLEDFIDFLEGKLDDLSSADNYNDKTNNALLYVASIKSSIEFAHENQDLFPLSDSFAKVKPESWWQKWGRCAASIAGGTLTGAGTGILGGAAVGTVVLPLVGTVSGAVLGGIVLGVGGGFTGAAAGC